jgi:hypothetical protein
LGTIVKRTATIAAVMSFFVLALVGWLSDVPTFTCGSRALIGAAAVYVLVTIASRILIRIAVDTMISSATQASRTEETSGERRA